MKRSDLCLLAMTTALVMPAIAMAQTSPPQTVPSAAASAAAVAAPQGLSEIVVTAQKRAERLNDVPMSITAASGNQLAKQGVSDPSQLEKIVPGFAYQESTFGNPVFTIRGIGLYDTSIGASPTVSIYVDQVPLPYLAMTEGAGLDLERLEALKGPQGILFGENSTGGAINYIAAKPTSQLHAGADLTYGRFNEFNLDGFVSGPITDTLKGRVAVRHDSGDGWQTSQSRPGDTLGQRDFTAARILLDWTPTSRLSVEVNANGWRDKSDTQAAQFQGFVAARSPAEGGYPEATAALASAPTAPRDDRVADWDKGANLRRNDRFEQASIRGDLDMGGGTTLSSITAYSHLKSYIPTDADGTAFTDFSELITGHIETVFQELRLAGSLGERTRYTVGGNYEHDTVDESDLGTSHSTNSGIGPFRYFQFNNLSNQDVTTAAVFGSADFKLTDTLTLQGGLRYTSQYRNFQGCVADPGDGTLAAGIAVIPAAAGLPYHPAANGACVTLSDTTLQTLSIVKDKLNQDNLSWRGGLNWQPDRDALVYANVTKGYKSGAFSPLPAVFASQLAPVTQESVLAYELGFKKELFEHRLQLSGAGFYYDYRNKQILGYESFPALGLNLPALQNIPISSVRGGELSAVVRPLKGLQITGGVTYVDSSVDGHLLLPDPLSKTVDIKGERFPSTPKWQIVSDAEYDFPIKDDLSGFFGGGVTYRSDSNAAFGNNPLFVIHGYALVDLRAGIEGPGGRWRLQVWGRNITNQYYLVNVAHVTDSIAALTGRPASYGVTLTVRY